MSDLSTEVLTSSFFELSVIGNDNRPDIQIKMSNFFVGKIRSFENLGMLLIKFAGELSNELHIFTSFIQSIHFLSYDTVEKYHCFFTGAFVPLLVRAAEPMGSVRHPYHKMDD